MEKTCVIPSRFSVKKAHLAQTCLSKKIITEDRLPQRIRLVAGVDVAYADDLAVGAVAVLDYGSLELVESQTAAYKVRFPYVPTLLSFRELPAAFACIRKLKTQPDVFLADGQGIAHPYSCGFASHLGLTIGKPTVGVAKSRLVGEPTEIHGRVLLVHGGKTVGAVLTTKKGAKPVYVSVGHLVSLDTAIRIVEHCSRNGRIPEPLSSAHMIASEKKTRNLMYLKREQRKQDGMRMKDESEAQTRKVIAAEIEGLEIRYETLKEYLVGRQIDDSEIVGVLRAYKDELSTISAHILTLYQLKGQRAKITWESLFTNIDTALETIQNSAHPKPRASIETALNMSQPKIEEVMTYLRTLKQSL